MTRIPLGKYFAAKNSPLGFPAQQPSHYSELFIEKGALLKIQNSPIKGCNKKGRNPFCHARIHTFGNLLVLKHLDGDEKKIHSCCCGRVLVPPPFLRGFFRGKF